MKKCNKCGEVKSLDLFALHAGFKSGRNSRCKECKNKEATEYFNNNRDKILSRQRISRKKTYRKNTYGIDEQQYLAAYEARNGCCEICNKHFDVLCIDHCHTTLEVRGLLCKSCNLGLGNFKDNSDALRSAAKYLEKGTGLSDC